MPEVTNGRSLLQQLGSCLVQQRLRQCQYLHCIDIVVRFPMVDFYVYDQNSAYASSLQI